MNESTEWSQAANKAIDEWCDANMKKVVRRHLEIMKECQEKARLKRMAREAAMKRYRGA